MMVRKLCILFSFCFLIFSPNSRAQDTVFNAQTFTLKNGLKVVLIENHRAPVVTHMVWYAVGAAHEPRGKSGIAHFLEHLLFKGSTYMDASGDVITLAPGEFSRVVKTMGGRDNAFTSQDYTAYFQSVPTKHLETVMRMEAGRMRGVVWDEDSFLPERQVILEERAMRTDSNPHARFYEHMIQVMYPNHPYGIPIIGWRHEIERLEMDDAKQMYDQYYAPNNALLVVSGDVDINTLQTLAEKIYGQIEPSTPLNNKGFTDIPPLDGTVDIVIRDKALRQPVMMMGARVDSTVTNYDNSLALEVLADILGNGSSSRLYKSLVVDQKIASNVSVSYSSDSLDITSFIISVTPIDENKIETIRIEVDGVIQDIIENGVSDLELRQSIVRMQDAAIFARDSLQGPAMIIGRALSSGVSLEQVETWPAKIQTVDAQSIQSVAQQYFGKDSDDAFIVHGVLLPHANEGNTRD